MRSLLLALVLTPGTVLAQDHAATTPGRAKCQASPQMAAKPQPLRPRTLKDQPQAEAYLTVLRIEGGCDQPVKVREYRRGRR